MHPSAASARSGRRGKPRQEPARLHGGPRQRTSELHRKRAPVRRDRGQEPHCPLLSASFSNRGDCDYYLVYDAIAASLSMIPHPPQHCPLTRLYAASSPRELRSALVLMERDGALCIWSPCAGIGPWQKMGRRFPQEAPKSFRAHVIFSSKARLSGPISRKASCTAPAATCSPAAVT